MVWIRRGGVLVSWFMLFEHVWLRVPGVVGVSGIHIRFAR